MFTIEKRLEYVAAMMRRVYSGKVAAHRAAMRAAILATIPKDINDDIEWLKSLPERRQKCVTTTRKFTMRHGVEKDSSPLRAECFSYMDALMRGNQFNEKTGELRSDFDDVEISDGPLTPERRYHDRIYLYTQDGLGGLCFQAEVLHAEICKFVEEAWAVLTSAKTEKQLLAAWPDAFEHLPPEAKQVKGSALLVVAPSHMREALAAARAP